MSNNWHRVSPLAILYFIIAGTVKFVREFAVNALPALAAGYFVIGNFEDFVSVAVAVLVVAVVGGAVLYYRHFRFQVLGDQIIVRQGVLTQKNISLNFARIQNVNLSTPFYFSPFGLVKCSFDSAGSDKNEINLPGISETLAADIAAQVRSYQTESAGQTESTGQGESAGDQASDAGQVPDLALDLKEVAKYGLTSNMAILLGAALFSVLSQLEDRVNIDVSAVLARVPDFLPFAGAWASLLAYAVLAIVALALLGAASSIGALIRFYGFQFYHEPDRLWRIAGLFEKHQIAVRKDKIQGVTVRQNAVARLLGRVTITFHQVEGKSGGQGGRGGKRFMIPLLPDQDWRRFVAMACPGFPEGDPLRFRRIDRRYVTRAFLKIVPVPVMAVTSFLVWKVGPEQLVWLLLLVPGWLIFWQRYRRFGFWENGEYAIQRRGFIGVRYTIFPIFKLQQAIEVQTPMQRRKGLKNLELQLAFRRLRIPYLPAPFVEDFIDRAIASVETDSRKWI